MVERRVAFDVLPGKELEFEVFFAREYRPAMSAMPGFVRVELVRDRQSPSTYCMLIRFESDEAAAAWRASEAHQALKPRLASLHRGSSLAIYDVIA
ncbi:MAG: antibiotic biosynthesis monooxygenase [Chloroflexota bacterium]